MGKNIKMKRKKVHQSDIDKVWLAALENGWTFLIFQMNNAMISFKKHGCRLNYYMTTGTVSTSLAHPRQGKSQLYRRDVGFSGYKKLLHNPRAHTGKGYYTK